METGKSPTEPTVPLVVSIASVVPPLRERREIQVDAEVLDEGLPGVDLIRAICRGLGDLPDQVIILIKGRRVGNSLEDKDLEPVRTRVTEFRACRAPMVLA